MKAAKKYNIIVELVEKIFPHYFVVHNTPIKYNGKETTVRKAVKMILGQAKPFASEVLNTLESGLEFEGSEDKVNLSKKEYEKIYKKINELFDKCYRLENVEL